MTTGSFLFLHKKANRLEFIHLSQKPIQSVTINHKIELLEYAPFLINHRPQICVALETEKRLVLKAPVRENGTYRCKGGQFDFFHILI